MGIKGLTKFLADHAPSALQMEARASLLGRVIAVDASMALYQFLTAVRDAQTMGNLTDEAGNVTSHLAGMLARVTRYTCNKMITLISRVPCCNWSAYLCTLPLHRIRCSPLRCIYIYTPSRVHKYLKVSHSYVCFPMCSPLRMLEQGIRPVYVFDGAAPEQKMAELEKRRERREEATALAEAAKEAGDTAELRKQLARTIRVSPEQNAEVQELLQLLGLPVVKAPGEAEAQCAELAKSGRVWATATEDADALTFGTPILIRNLTFSDSSTSSKAAPANGNGGKAAAAGSAKGHPILSIHLEKVLKALELTMDQFIDFCILCGCDYCGTIRGIGAKTAYTLIKHHNNIETVLEHLDKEKYPIPENFSYQAARELFKQPLVMPAADLSLKWGEVDEKGLKKFLVEVINIHMFGFRGGGRGQGRSSSFQAASNVFLGDWAARRIG